MLLSKIKRSLEIGGLIRLYVVTLLLSSYAFVAAQDWFNPTGENVQTVFFQGMMDSQKQCAKFCGENGMNATTGEHVTCPNSTELIYHPYIGKELDEIILENDVRYAWYNPLSYIGILQRWGFQKQRQRYNYLIEGTQPGKPSVSTHSIDFFKLNFGQERDIEECSRKIAACDQDFPGATKILWGTSRGAAAWFDGHAHRNYDNVKMLVCEGCFDTVGHTIEKRTPWLLKKLGVHILFHYFLAAVTEYKTEGISPLTSVEKFPEKVPLVFITSAADTNVAQECTYALLQKLKKRNKNPLHCLILKDTPHNIYSLGKGEDQEKYLHFMHCLYKKYNLPHIPQYAQ
jgi:hypothetical protein